jgi:hypothetical protein
MGHLLWRHPRPLWWGCLKAVLKLRLLIWPLGTRSALVATLLHFPELETKLELLGSWCDARLTEDLVDAL